MKTQHKKSEYVLTSREAENLINSAKTFEHRCILKCMYFGGMRVSEVANLEVQHIDFSRNIINIMESKRGKSRTIPFIDSAFKADLLHLIDKKQKDKVFKIAKRQMQRVVESTAAKAGIRNPDPTAKHLNAHLLRHSIARRLKQEGYTPEFIQKFLGHSTYNTTMDQYGTMSLNEMQEIVFRKQGDSYLQPKQSYVPEVQYLQ